MPPPDPKLRISPSGPLTEADTDPLAEYAGAIFQVQPDFSDPYIDARIGPSDAPSDRAPNTFISRQGVTATIPQAPNTGKITSFAEAVDIFSEDFSFGLGLWLVEAKLTMGFNTTMPGNNDWGQLTSQFQLVDDANAIVKSSAVIEGIHPRGVNITAQTAPTAPFGVPVPGAEGVATSVTIQSFLEIEAADIAANNSQPFKGLQLELTRVNQGSSNFLGYSSDSGWLEFSAGTSYLAIKRFR